MIVYSESAEADIVELAGRITLDNVVAGIRLAESIRASGRLLHEAPGIGRVRRFQHPMLRGARSLAVRGFPNYLIFYKPIDAGIRIIRIIHGARDIRSTLLLKR